MKVNDLMIGDWVSHNDLPYKNGKISSIDEKSRFVTIRNASGNEAIRVLVKNVEPIPMTPEILEKNGFKYDDYESCWKLIEKGRYSYSIRLNGYIISIHNWRKEEAERFTDACNKGYVHELQRALRFCELWDLADNFKIK